MIQPFKHVLSALRIEDIWLIDLKTSRSEPWNGVTCGWFLRSFLEVLHVALLLQVCWLPFAPCNESSEHLVALHFANDSYRSCKDTSQKSMCLDRSSNLFRESQLEKVVLLSCAHMHPCIHPWSIDTHWYTLNHIDTFTIWMEMRRCWKESVQLSCWFVGKLWLVEVQWTSCTAINRQQKTTNSNNKILFCFPPIFSLFFWRFVGPVATSDSENSFILSPLVSTCQPHLASAPNKYKEMNIWEQNERGESFESREVNNESDINHSERLQIASF